MADGVINADVVVTFDLILRTGSDDQLLQTWSHQFVPIVNSSDAEPFEASALLDRVPAEAGDQLVFRYAATETSVLMAYIPNGDGGINNGRIPYIELPQ